MLFDIETIDFGQMNEGEVLSVQYTFINVYADSVAVEIVSACDCMNVEWTRDAIAPGKRGYIDILFNTSGQQAEVFKDIDVIFKNTDHKGYPWVKRLQLKGRINKK